jgi:hypothetical protein
MAIHSDSLGVRAEVMVDGQALREYEDPSDTSEARTVTRYIEAITGADFWVKVVIEARLLSSKLSVDMKIDGKSVGNLLVCPSKEDSILELRHVREIFNGKVFLSNMRFSELSISKCFNNALQVFSNDAAGEDDIEDASHAVDIGTIEVKVCYALGYRRVLCKKPTKRLSKQAIPEDHERIREVSETALKGRIRSHFTRSLTHLPIITKPRLTRLHSKHNTEEHTDRWNRFWANSAPLITFQFKYRSHGL